MVAAVRSLVPLLATLALGVAACGVDDAPPVTDRDGTVGGRVLLTLDGPLVGADVSVDQLEYTAATVVVREHIGDTLTDADGHFEMLTGTASGYFLITTRGGQFRDYATGQAVVLDPADELTALLYTDLLEDLTTGLVTPVSHLAHRMIVARTAAGTDAWLLDSYALVTQHLDQHFGALRWERAAPASLADRATSPTDAVRAAFVLAAWSTMARDIAGAAGASVQEVNPYTLALALGRDLAAGPFDGDDGNDRAAGSGIQLGACPAPAPGCVPAGACDLGACRTACDAYAGTPRTTLAAAVTALINDNGPTGHNQTGLAVADTLSFARAIATNTDPILFADACIDELDRLPPTLTWGAMPADGAVIRGTAAWTVRAADNVDAAPVITWDGGLVDTDGAPNSAATSIDTTLATDRSYTVSATATDATGNHVTESRTVVADNLAPVLTLDQTDPSYVIDTGTGTWWTASATPHLRGTVTDAHGPITVEARILGQLVATTTVAGGAWDLALPAGSIAAGGNSVVLRATDAPGNPTADAAATSPFLRIDATPPTVDGLATTFIDETQDIITFGAAPIHTHSGAPSNAVTLGTVAPPTCPTVKKYAYRTDRAPVGSEIPANPVALAMRASDAGVGLDTAGTTFTVTAPSGQVFGPFPLTSAPAVGAPGAFDSLADLRRDQVTAIGAPASVQEGTFTVTFTARDHLGQTATLARCFTYAPLGPPLQVVTGPRAATTSTYVKTFADYALPTGPTSALLNATATAGILELWVKNLTPDPAYVTVTAPPPPAATYSKQIVTYLEPTTQQTVSLPNCNVIDPQPGEDALCAGPSPAPLATVNASGSIAGWTPYIGLFEVNITGTAIAGVLPPCAGCAADQRKVDPGAQLAIVVGAAGIAELQPDVAGPYREVTGDFTGAVAPAAPTVQGCIAWSATNGAGVRHCTRIQNYRQNRTLQTATVTLSPSAATVLAADWSSRAFATAAIGAPATDIQFRRLTGPTPFSWPTTEN